MTLVSPLATSFLSWNASNAASANLEGEREGIDCASRWLIPSIARTQDQTVMFSLSFSMYLIHLKMVIDPVNEIGLHSWQNQIAPLLVLDTSRGLANG